MAAISVDTRKGVLQGRPVIRLLNGLPEEDPGEGSKSPEEDILFGPMRIQQKPMTILLVFPHEDEQSQGLWQAAERLDYTCTLAMTPETALDSFLQRHHDVVFIDSRSPAIFDADRLCKTLRASSKSNDYSVMVAVCSPSPTDKEEPSILPLLKAGFHRRFLETSNVGACANELRQLSYGEVRTQRKLRACGALVTALDNVSDAVKVTNDVHTIQYVNKMYERISGFSTEELVGKDARDLNRSERNKEVFESITANARKGKHWEGTFYTRRKSGGVIPYHCRVVPVVGPMGKISQYVTLKSASADTVSQIANGGLYPRRRESVARMQNTAMVEAPITRVISMINAAQETSPLSVSEALEKVVEILRTSELYAPSIPHDDDPMTNDLVGGLLSQNMNTRQDNQPFKIASHHLHPHTHPPPASLSQVPQNVLNILEKEPTWSFDIIQLEEASHKRPLLYLGLKTFSRFEACEFLGIEERVLVNWLQLIESNYHSKNHYHNSTHAADVLHASAFFLECQRTKLIFDSADCVASLIAATIHDVDHPARTNAFLVNESNPLAILYNDLAVLESHHSSLAFRLTHRDNTVNIFQNMKRDNYHSLRTSIVDMVLATEMKQHFEHLNKFNNTINKSILKYDTDEPGPTGTFDNKTVISQLSTPDHRVLIKRMLIKCADVSNPVRPWKLCVKWAQRIAEEYCSQTDEEIRRNLQVVMPVFNRKTCSIPKSQTSFIDVFINHMFDAWDYYCDIPDLMNNLQDNYHKWKEMEENPKMEGAVTVSPVPLAPPTPTPKIVSKPAKT